MSVVIRYSKLSGLYLNEPFAEQGSTEIESNSQDPINVSENFPISKSNVYRESRQ